MNTRSHSFARRARLEPPKSPGRAPERSQANSRVKGIEPVRLLAAAYLGNLNNTLPGHAAQTDIIRIGDYYPADFGRIIAENEPDFGVLLVVPPDPIRRGLRDPAAMSGVGSDQCCCQHRAVLVEQHKIVPIRQRL